MIQSRSDENTPRIRIVKGRTVDLTGLFRAKTRHNRVRGFSHQTACQRAGQATARPIFCSHPKSCMKRIPHLATRYDCGCGCSTHSSSTHLSQPFVPRPNPSRNLDPASVPAAGAAHEAAQSVHGARICSAVGRSYLAYSARRGLQYVRYPWACSLPDGSRRPSRPLIRI